uniref:G_PROTEIN_RECEP_F1_2 domain-containing protein n=1 Tax=Steinernema glaseri TaxID=37863 RepID=A0A1I7ZUZ5_9BILA
METNSSDEMVLGKIASLHEHLVALELPSSSPSPSSGRSVIPLVEIVLGTITYLVIIIMTVIGNSMVVLAVFNYRPLKKVQNYFLVSLAASDLAVAVFVMPLHVVKFLADGRWLFGVTVCQLFTTMDILLCTSSILNLCAIAIDRYWAIHDPINYAQRRTLKFVLCIIVLVWVTSGVISVPPLIGWNDWSSQKLMQHCELTTEKAFVVFSASGSFFVPLAVMIIVYVKIFLSARQRIRTNRGRSALLRINDLPPERRDTQKRKSNEREDEPFLNNNEENAQKGEHALVRQFSQDSSKTTSGNRSSKEPPKETAEQITRTVLRKREKISVAKEKRAAKTIAVIIFVFSFCWLPFFCAYVILPFCESCSIHPKVAQAFTWLGYINSSLNPFLYGILNLEFRRAFKKILCSKTTSLARSQRTRR